MADPSDGMATVPEFYRLLFEANPQPMWVFDPLTLAILDANEAAAAHYGYPRTKLLRMSFTDLIAPGEEDSVREAVARTLQDDRAGMRPVGLQRHRLRDGRPADVEISFGVVRSDDAVVILALAHDVTERKFAEEALWASEAQMRGILENALDAIVLMDARGLVLSWNPRAEALFGWSRAEAVGHRMTDLIVPPRYREAHTRGLQRYLETGEGAIVNRPVDVEALRRDGSEFPVALHVSALHETDRIVFCAFIEDITERKRAQELVARAERQLSTAQRITHIGSWQWDVGGAHVTWSDELYRIYGLEPQEHAVTYQEFLSRVHPDDRAQVEARVRESVERGGSFAFDERIVRPDGSVRLLMSQGEAIRGEDGRVSGLIGTCLDVTERRQEEERQRQAEERFEKAFRSSPAATSITSLEDGRLLDVNDAFVRLTGMSREEVIGRTAIELGAWGNAEDRARFMDLLARDGQVRRTKLNLYGRQIVVSAQIIELAGVRCVLAQSEDLVP